MDLPDQPLEHRRTIEEINAVTPEALAARDQGAPEDEPAACRSRGRRCHWAASWRRLLATNPIALAAQEVDFGAMSTEEVWAWEKQQEEAKLLDESQDRAENLKAAQEAQLLDEPHSGESLKPHRNRNVSAYRDMVRGHLTRFADSIAGFYAGAREVNTICKIGPSEHQLVNCLDIARRKVQRGAVPNPGGYLNNTLRNVVAGMVPTRKALPCKSY